MKTIFVLSCLLLSLVSTLAWANINFGKKIEFVSENNRPIFGVFMTSSSTALTFAISADDVTQRKNITKIQIRFADKVTGEFLSDLIVLMDSPKSVGALGKLSFTTTMTGIDALKVQSMLKTSVVLIGVKDGDNNIFSGYVDLGELCSTSQVQFQNLETGASGCPSPGAYSKIPKLSECLSKIVIEKSWVGKISSELSCLSKISDFVSGMNYLCSKNQNALSSPYQKYIDLNAKVNAAFAAYQSAKDPVAKLEASQNLEDAKRQRSLFGFENEVQQALSAASGAHETCHSKN